MVETLRGLLLDEHEPSCYNWIPKPTTKADRIIFNTLITKFTTLKLTFMKDNNPTATYVQGLHFWPSTKISKFIL